MAAGDIITDPVTGDIALDASGNILTANASGFCPDCCATDTCVSGVGDECYSCGFGQTSTPKQYTLVLSGVAACAGCIVATASTSANTITLHGINATHVLVGAGCNWQKLIVGGLTYTQYTGAGCVVGATAITADVSIVLNRTDTFWRLTLTGSNGEQIFDSIVNFTEGCLRCSTSVSFPSNSLACGGASVGVFAQSGSATATPCTLPTSPCSECSFCCEHQTPYECPCKTPPSIVATISGCPTSGPCMFGKTPTTGTDCVTLTDETAEFLGLTQDPNRTVTLQRVSSCTYVADVPLDASDTHVYFRFGGVCPMPATGGRKENGDKIRYVLTFTSATTFTWAIFVTSGITEDIYFVAESPDGSAYASNCNTSLFKRGTYTDCQTPFSITHDTITQYFDEDFFSYEVYVASAGSTTFTPSCT